MYSTESGSFKICGEQRCYDGREEICVDDPDHEAEEHNWAEMITERDSNGIR
jgi:hypothetical protein